MIVDTNILIAYLGGEELVIEFLDEWRSNGGLLYLPTIVETELLSFPGWTESESQEVRQFLEENFISIPFDRKIAQLSADLRKNKK